MKSSIHHLNRIILILDLDGVLTDGKFYYSDKGKILKAFGPDDHDAIKLLLKFIEVEVVTADKIGFEISRQRVEHDMGLKLHLVNSEHRGDWIQARFPDYFTIYMGDGIFDKFVFEKVKYSIAPANAADLTKEIADHVTHRSGGDRAVAEACLHILAKFFDVDYSS
jgi:3-deoxy-D-manno-octulosonate 8-phosphate phosphatase (KDO 8-P phosphatase)